MSDTYRHLKFGSINGDLNQATVVQDQAILRSFINTFDRMGLTSCKEAHFEIFNIAKAWIGPNFRHWLLANYYNGTGARKELVASFVNYVNGKVAGRTVINQIKADFRRIPYLGPTSNGQLQLPTVYDGRPSQGYLKVGELDFSIIHDYHLNDLFALVGPELIAQLILSLDGISNE